jgi:transglutaminase-like putative cysteine protease
LRLHNDAVVEDSGLPDAADLNAVQHSLNELPTDTLTFLLPSRYCEVEKLSDIAWNLFGNTPLGWPRVKAICDWAHQRIQFGYEFARGDRTAFEAYTEQRGVCRDFMHLAITLCRCMGIPARYATGYLGDICVPPVPFPMDFSAWFEVYVGGQWYTMDARHNVPRVGRVLMARGRDAADVALFTTFGRHALESFKVWTDELKSEEASKVMAIP